MPVLRMHDIVKPVAKHVGMGLSNSQSYAAMPKVLAWREIV